MQKPSGAIRREASNDKLSIFEKLIPPVIGSSSCEFISSGCCRAKSITIFVRICAKASILVGARVNAQSRTSLLSSTLFSYPSAQKPRQREMRRITDTKVL